MKYLKRFFWFLAKYKWRMAIFLFVVTIGVVISTIRPYWLKMILDEAESNNSQGILFYFFLFGVSTITAEWISTLAYFLGDRVLFPFSKEIRETIFKKVLDLDFAYHVNKNTGTLISAFKRGDAAINNIFFDIFQELFRILIILLATLYFLAITSINLAFLLIILFILNMLLIWWLIKINIKTRSDFNNAEDEVSGVITDSLLNYETVKFFAGEKKESFRLGQKFNIWTKALWKFANSFRMMDITIGTLSGAGMLFMLWIVINGLGTKFNLGDLVMISGFLTSFYWQFFNLFFRIRSLVKNMIDLEKYFEILDNETLVKDPKKEKIPRKLVGNLEFINVGFLYPSDQEMVLEGINFKIKSGQQGAFVGKSGAGKTTLVKLLLRFYDPTRGIIKLDGVDIRKMKKSRLRSLISVVPQEPIMFNNTIKFNLAYGKEGASDKEIFDAAQKANILEFIEGLPNKWETQVGERGIKLSGGQKQRLAIARALLAKPKVLVFDEATSNLDSESEGKIQASLEQASKERTVLIIAHRFSTIRNADKIFVLDAGTIVEEGNHQKLIAKNGLYKMLWTLQAKGKLEEKS
jgi:ATP-binding cassette, subfamily B, heavy metal transporter